MSTGVLDPVTALGHELIELEEDELAALLGSLDPVDLSVAERALALVAGIGWRANPSTMAAHFDPEWNRWRYVELLGEKFRSAADGTDPHQIWMLPSQYGKTTMLRWAVIWLLDRDPSTRILYLSYNADKAREEGGKTRDLAERFSGELGFEVARDHRSKRDWKTTAGGGLYSTGIDGSITGFPQDALLLDDLIKGYQAAHSDAQRNHAWDIYRSQARLRIQSHTLPIIVAGTRWHEDDPQSRLMAMQDEEYADQWTVVRLAAIAERAQPNHRDPLLRDPDPLGRKPGEVLEPARFEKREVMARRVVLGTYLWSAMEQQRPAPAEGDEIKRAWWRWTTNLPTEADVWVTSWDMKLKEKESGDYQVGQVWSRTGDAFFGHAQLRGQWTVLKCACAIALLAYRFPLATRHYVENTGNGPEVMEVLRGANKTFLVPKEIADSLAMTPDERKAVGEQLRAGLPGVIPVTPVGDKKARARAVTAFLEAGNVWLPETSAGIPKDWAGALVDECAAFPQGAHDDQVDAWSQAMAAMLGRVRVAAMPGGGTQPSNWR